MRRFAQAQKLHGVILVPRASEDQALADMLAEIGCRYTRIASASACVIAPVSPVASADAMPPALPAIRAVICAPSRARRPVCSCGGVSIVTGAKPRPVAPIPANHATRA